MKPLHAAFEKKYGITVDYWRGSSTQVSERALTESRAGKPGFDVVEGNRGVQLIMRDEGLFQKFIPPSSEKFPAQFKEKDGMITQWRVLPISILYNTDMVKSGDLPKTFDDLLSPKWTGKAKAFAAGVLLHRSERHCPRRKSGGDHLRSVCRANERAH